jgi:flagellar biosynthesis protein
MSDDPTKKPAIAIALNYDQKNAPTVAATGQNELAERIVELAEEHDIPLHNDPELAALLSRIPLGDEIPENLYRAVAEVIAFAYLLTGKFPAGFQENQED